MIIDFSKRQNILLTAVLALIGLEWLFAAAVPTDATPLPFASLILGCVVLGADALAARTERLWLLRTIQVVLGVAAVGLGVLGVVMFMGSDTVTHLMGSDAGHRCIFPDDFSMSCHNDPLQPLCILSDMAFPVMSGLFTAVYLYAVSSIFQRIAKIAPDAVMSKRSRRALILRLIAIAVGLAAIYFMVTDMCKSPEEDYADSLGHVEENITF